ncbi:hypothetical protein B0H17DRAFT_1131702 [Mycena rosella]|uniref:Uncharacterized protein n=1 Tax=Mycena rosella TaxID=1033263 RepID=A0AAD7DMD5_MYCRO|nr:hypothetical protein B0H17DRAFT_1131702 [Mycena rosella]
MARSGQWLAASTHPVTPLQAAETEDTNRDLADNTYPVIRSWLDDRAIVVDVSYGFPEYICAPGGGPTGRLVGPQDLRTFPFNVGDTLILEVSLHFHERAFSAKDYLRDYTLIAHRIQFVRPRAFESTEAPPGSDGLLDLDLARQFKLSWVNDIVIVLSDLPIPVYWKVTSNTAVEVKTIDGLIADVTHSMEACIQAELSAYSRTRDLLPDRVVMEDDKWVHTVLAFRMPCAGNGTDAVERALQTTSAKKVAAVPLLQDHLGDAIHTMFVCKQSLLVEIRNAFFAKLFKIHPELHGVYSDPGLFFKDLLVKEKVIGLLGKLAYDVFEVFYSEPMLVINPALYIPPNPWHH